jgi:hypothetical protein
MVQPSHKLKGVDAQHISSFGSCAVVFAFLEHLAMVDGQCIR